MATTLNLTITMIGSDIAYCKVIAGNIGEIIKIYSSQSGHTVSANNNFPGYDIYIQPCDNSGNFVSATWSNYSSGTPSGNSTIVLPSTTTTFSGTITSSSSSGGGGDSGGGGSSITSSKVSVVFDEGIEYVDIYIDGTLKTIVRDSNFEHYYSPPSNNIQFKAALKNGYNFKINYLYTDSSSISSSNDTLYANFISSYYNATFSTTSSGSGGGGDSGGSGGGDSGGSSGGIDYGFYVGEKFCRIYIYDDNNVKHQVAIKVNGKYLGRKT